MARKRILVTDDDPCILKLVTVILTRAGYEVDTAIGGREALEKCDRTHYDVLMLDLMMPEVSGFDVLARLQIRDPLPRFVVVMSAASHAVIASALFPNVFAVVRKPFEIAEMLTTVGECVKQPAPVTIGIEHILS